MPYNDPNLGLYNYTISHTNPTKQRGMARDATRVVPPHAFAPERANMSDGRLTGKNATLSLAPTWEETVNNMLGNLSRSPAQAAPVIGAFAHDSTGFEQHASNAQVQAMLPPSFRKTR